MDLIGTIAFSITNADIGLRENINKNVEIKLMSAAMYQNTIKVHYKLKGKLSMLYSTMEY